MTGLNKTSLRGGQWLYGCLVAMLTLISGCEGGRLPADDSVQSRAQSSTDEVPTPITDLIASTPGLNGGFPAGPPLQGPTLPLNALEALLSLTASQLADMLEPTMLDDVPLQPVPQAECNADSHPLAGMQGRVPQEAVNSLEAAYGWTCNLSVVSHYPSPGGFRVWRYTDKAGHSCAYYDTSFTAPANIVSVAGGPSLGVIVLDMTDPANPVITDTLTSLAMLAPHESLNLHPGRGLLAANTGNGLTLPGAMAVYDVSEDCRYPELKGQKPIAFGHESGFSPDGNTFWVAGGAGYILAVDVSDPATPEVLWRGAYYSHGLTVSADGNTLYHTDPINGSVGLIDVSEIQARKANPQVHEISRVTWPTASIPQNTIPFRSGGKDYLFEFDEFAFRFNPATITDQVGAARILNIDDPAAPYLVSNVRLEVNMRDAHHEAASDPSALPPTQVFGYSFHYCAIPRYDNPQIVACTAMNSGLRVFDISNPAAPREIAYFLAPPKAGSLAGLLPGNLAMSQPAFVPERREIWYTDASSGFYVVKLAEEIWPQ